MFLIDFFQKVTYQTRNISLFQKILLLRFIFNRFFLNMSRICSEFQGTIRSNFIKNFGLAAVHDKDIRFTINIVKVTVWALIALIEER